MKSVREYGYAKVNLFLDIVGVNDDFHMLDTVVVTVDLRDKIILTGRNDDKITIKEAGNLYRIGDDDNNNAVRAAKLFMETFKTRGVDIYISKHIPIGSGMGGSSADISAVLKGMKKLYDIDEDILPLANALGSDSGYLLSGGYARLNGKGDIITPLDLKNKLYFVIITAEGGVNTGKCFKLYDEGKAEKVPNSAVNLIEKLGANTFERADFYNALYPPAIEINPLVKEVYEDILALSPRGVCMSGSGSSVFGIFDTPELCLWAHKKLCRKYPNALVTESLTYEELNKPSWFERALYN